MRRWRAWGLFALAAALAGVVLATGAASRSTTRAARGAANPPPSPAPTTPVAAAGYSNIYAVDYVGPEACGACHQARHAQWRRSLHASMNRLAAAPAVLGDFAGARVAYAGGSASFDTTSDGPVMTLVAASGARRRFRVTRTIGARYLQEYVGVLLEGPEPPGDPLYTTEIRLPFGYWLRQRAWFHQQYFDSWYDDEYGPDGTAAVDAYAPDPAPWAARCAWCHNTYPFELRALRARGPRPLGQGTEQYFELLHERRPPAAIAAIATDNRLPIDELVTVGVSCESCHLGGREHAQRDQEIRFAPTSDDLRARPDAPDLAGGRQNAVLVNTICAQCHSTPTPRFADGSGARNSSEALDQAAGTCTTRIKCTDCHDPHVAGAGATAPDAPRHVQACSAAGCHAHLATPAAARAHARHDPGAASCLDCHMPKIVQGVSDFTRSHRISTPAALAMLAAGAPNACNLCHLDRSITWTLTALASGWGRRLAPDHTWGAHYGGRLDAPLGEVWLRSRDPLLRAVAAAAYARAPRGRAALPALLEILDDPVAYYRMRTLFAIEDLLGRRLAVDEYDPTAAPAVRATQAGRLRARATTLR